MYKSPKKIKTSYNLERSKLPTLRTKEMNVRVYAGNKTGKKITAQDEYKLIYMLPTVLRYILNITCIRQKKKYGDHH